MSLDYKCIILLLEEEKENIQKELNEIIILREQKDAKQKEKENLQKEYHLLARTKYTNRALFSKSFEENEDELSVLKNELDIIADKKVKQF